MASASLPGSMVVGSDAAAMTAESPLRQAAVQVGGHLVTHGEVVATDSRAALRSLLRQVTHAPPLAWERWEALQRLAREVIHRRSDPLPVLTWNLAPVPLSLAE